MFISTLFSSAFSSTKDSSISKPRRHPSRLSSSLVKSALGVALAMGVLTGGQAQALIVEMGDGEEWNVTTFTGSYDANRKKFDTPENGGVMPWWSNLDESDPISALQFALAVKDSLGMPNLGGLLGPLFPMYGAPPCAWASRKRPVCALSPLGFDLNFSDDNLVYAQVEVYFPPVRPRRGGAGPDPDEVPGPLPVLGAAAAFGFSRKLRKRIKSNANPVPTTHSC